MPLLPAVVQHRVVLVGPERSGKSNFCQIALTRSALQQYRPTIGASYAQVKRSRYDGDHLLSLWDVARGLVEPYTRPSQQLDAFLVFLDSSQGFTDVDLQWWLHWGRHATMSAVVLTHTDLTDPHVVATLAARARDAVVGLQVYTLSLSLTDPAAVDAVAYVLDDIIDTVQLRTRGPGGAEGPEGPEGLYQRPNHISCSACSTM